MTSLSGVACILGASVICIDIIIRQFPGKRDFRIQDSDTFLSMSLSLSFGVMLFSALYSMLPSAKKSLMEGGYSPKEASWILIVCFIGGVVGIQLISRVLHQYVPSHVVDCEHNHEEDGPKEDVEAHGHSHAPEVANRPRRSRTNSLPGHTPLGPKMKSSPVSKNQSHLSTTTNGDAIGSAEPDQYEELSKAPSEPVAEPARRPSLHQRLTSGISKLTSRTKANCDCDGPCYGFSDICGSECFKNVNANGGARGAPKPTSISSRPSAVKSATATTLAPLTESTPLLQNINEEHSHNSIPGRQAADTVSGNGNASASHSTSEQTLSPNQHPHTLHKTHSHETTSSHNPDHHHHHVPQNAFLSIGLQTSIAIALHKLPEGFITYATNHANPRLGVAVFLALFIHNITEGFAMALPLYLALNSRTKAMATSFVLGGLSQPIGAGVAALWFHIAGNGDWAPSEGVYGGMFAATAGIMASVALQLFSESLDLTHSRGLCMVGAFLGMGILGISSALTA